MQRAASSGVSKSPNSNDDGHSSKRRKLVKDAGATTIDSDMLRMKIALDEEEAKRERAVERLAEEVGDTKWELSTLHEDPTPQNSNSFTFRIDAARSNLANVDQESLSGRKKFGKQSQKHTSSAGQSASESSGYSSHSDHTPGPDDDARLITGLSNQNSKISSHQR